MGSFLFHHVAFRYMLICEYESGVLHQSMTMNMIKEIRHLDYTTQINLLRSHGAFKNYPPQHKIKEHCYATGPDEKELLFIQQKA